MNEMMYFAAEEEAPVVPILGGIGAGVVPLPMYHCLCRISEHRCGNQRACDDPLVEERPGADAAAGGETPLHLDLKHLLPSGSHRAGTRLEQFVILSLAPPPVPRGGHIQIPPAHRIVFLAALQYGW